MNKPFVLLELVNEDTFFTASKFFLEFLAWRWQFVQVCVIEVLCFGCLPGQTLQI